MKQMIQKPISINPLRIGDLVVPLSDPIADLTELAEIIFLDYESDLMQISLLNGQMTSVQISSWTLPNKSLICALSQDPTKRTSKFPLQQPPKSLSNPRPTGFNSRISAYTAARELSRLSYKVNVINTQSQSIEAVALYAQIKVLQYPIKIEDLDSILASMNDSNTA